MISPLAYVDPAAKIGKDVTIHPFAYIAADTVIGDGCEIFPFASIMSGARLGKNNKIFNGAVISAQPQDFRWKGQPTLCTIGDNNVIREQVIINRAIAPEGVTRIGSDCFIMAETHIGHDSTISSKCVIGNGVKIAGDVFIDECTILSSNVMINEHVKVSRWVFVKGGCRISNNVPPFVIIAHNPVKYYGVNAPIMTRHGKFTQDEVEDAAKAYRHIYQTQTSTFNALNRIEGDIAPGRVRDNILKFVRDNNYKIIAIPVQQD